MALIICCAFLGIGMSKLRAQTLAAGDIAFIGYDFGTTDGFSFIALKALPAGETIYFSEQGWTGTGWAANSETHLQWVIPATVPIGTIITVMETSADTFTVSGTSGFSIALNSNFNLSGGDQILAYQSTTGVAPASPIFIAGVHGDYNSTNYDPVTTWNSSNTAGTAESVVPTGLANGVNCISLFPAPGPEQAYSKYTGTLTGTATALRTAINNTANWTKTGTATLGLLPANFPTPNITAEVVNPTVTSTAASGVGAVKATLGGNVTADGGASVTERGIVWGLTANPTTSDNKVIIGSGTGTFSSVVSSLPANTTVNFRAFATNSSGTAYGNNLTFTTNAALTATTSSTNVSCNGGSNGTATVTASGGVTPYTYSWSPAGGTAATASGLAVGVYTCTITDNEGSSITRNVTITQPSTLGASSAKTNVSCNGGSNGSATVVPSGGTSPYTYSWAPSGGTGATASGLSVGSYTCTITDANGCTINRGFTITQPSAMSITTSRTDVACNGGSNGVASVSVTGGVPPYSYSWSPLGGTAATASGLAAGTYTVTITDANSCTATRTFTIAQPTAISVTPSQTNVACNGGTNGTATVSVTGGTPGYTYSWAPSGGTAATATGLAAGTYTCTITDANACTKTQTFTITQPTALTATTSSTNVSCNGGSNGTATVSVSGGTPGYTYSWAPRGGTAATASGLSVGTYTCTITDANACSITRTVTITQPTALTSTASMTTVACNGGSNGMATINVSGGTAPYTYSWAPSGGTAATATGLAAGTYTVTVTDANACTLTRTFTVTQPTAISVTPSQTNVACNGGSNGTATVSVTGGTPGYTYSWSPTGGTAATATGLAAGTYTCTITDANACTKTQTFTITQPTALTATSSFTTVSCNGGANGTASVTASGGTGPYTYSWAPSGGTAATATGLPVGVYTCTITDANACSITRSVTITQPSALTSTASMTTVACNGGSNGVASINVSGGTAPYTYSWAPSGGTAATASGLPVGVYTVTVTDANACTLTRSFTITQPPALVVNPLMQTNIACNGGATGSASVSVSGGTPGYTYSWSPSGGTAATATGLVAGTYTCTVTDANNCTKTQTFTITQPSALQLAYSGAAVVNKNTAFTYTFLATGGTTSYSYSSSGTLPTGLTLSAGGVLSGTPTVAGDYSFTVSVTDANACTKTVNVSIKVEDPLPVDLINFAAKAVATGVEVTWATKSESNSSHFELLHATEKGEFKPLAKVDALGDSKVGKRYSFLHKNAINGQNYYQLLQVDRNGDTKDYGVKQVNFSQAKDEVSLFPNPASHAITVKFPANVYNQLQVIDMLGKVVMSSKITAKDQEHKLNIALLPAGVYTVVLTSGNTKTVHKFIKQ
ncbi:T9SS type A sorting domain-containing protein [Pedobacter sp.]|uniref:T9SS type A sorting domain-containing protein n=1 Tax=Pedobacter sp. TaxID=1411316 RepID=UPI0031CDEBD1